ncbi:RNA polymerase sigma factor SigA [Aquisphaera giovannonii]|uniref:RNA polymerase sigma factor SigA n=1 Tax=Aquisphaera giovannonii TaxID=406548 RepID=A0A5B9WA01_9BACT|nr:sigma-70 family RNA polymerase sigma factor [Aquisphaera giovannonii]QEH36911.1 RNA polymerase sigma factor SigA [Aquisphaera giovannonii]
MASHDLLNYDGPSAAILNRDDVRVLTPEEERALLVELQECKTSLVESWDNPRNPRVGPPSPVTAEDGEEVQDFVRRVLRADGIVRDEGKELAAIAARYDEIRTKLAMANVRLVAHVVRKYRNRGVSSSDLLQEGFCGLLKAIDRFEPSKETRLASYAVWWIRQTVQRAVAAGAYPVRLNPRHLQQLADSNEDLAGKKSGSREASRSGGSQATIRQIHAATRPTISLDATAGAGRDTSLLSQLAYPMEEDVHDPEMDEYLMAMMNHLKPREQTVLQLRFGLGGRECHSLSQVSVMLDVSKERIRQIQETALRKLRGMAEEHACLAVGH